MRSPVFLRFLIAQFDRIAIIVTFLVLLAIALFARSYLYLTYTDAQAIAVLRTTVAVEDLDHERLLRVRAALDTRDAIPPLDPATVRDAFSGGN